jgi:hypothetical protein
MPDLSRRKMLALVGGGTVLAATGAATAFVATRTPTAARAPWDMAGRYPDPRLRALSWGLLAPNPHNRQPWEAELRGDDAIAIWRDPARDLPVTDPFARQLTIGMGCFLELTEMAAAQEGLAMAGILTREAAMDPGNPGTRANIEATAEAILAAPAMLSQVTATNTRADQIETGRRWLRLNLAATGAGLAVRPVSQALQEYPEIAAQRAAVQDLLAPEGGTVQMLSLLGYGARTPRTPRWALETRMRS